MIATATLCEKYRPQVLGDVIGQPKVVAGVESILSRGGFGGRKVYLSGSTGVGKSTLAGIIARTVAHPESIIEWDSGELFGMPELARWNDNLGQYGWGGRGRVLILNECHGLRAAVVRSMLGMLERLPRLACVILTTTNLGEALLFDGIDSKPLVDRCLQWKLTNQGLAESFAVRAMEIAKLEGLESGQPLGAYVKLMQSPKVKNSPRACLEQLDAGCFLGGGE